ncbi:MAG: hypothetical protein QOF72_2644, partial [Blastocatellia bacterium]|nr:hypothetical protein [Blastocatellia bacterium]
MHNPQPLVLRAIAFTIFCLTFLLTMAETSVGQTAPRAYVARSCSNTV